MGKEEIVRNEHFLLFPQRFQPNQKFVSKFINIFDIISLFADELEEPKIGISIKGLKELQESLRRCTGRRDITERLLKTELNTIQSINQLTMYVSTNFKYNSSKTAGLGDKKLLVFCTRRTHGYRDIQIDKWTDRQTGLVQYTHENIRSVGV